MTSRPPAAKSTSTISTLTDTAPEPALAASPDIAPESANAPDIAPETEPASSSVASAVLSTVLAPLAAPGTDMPVDSPALWVLAAAARRQFDPDSASLGADSLLRTSPGTGPPAGDTGEEPVAFAALFAALTAPTPQLSTSATVGTGASPSGVAISGGHAYVTNQNAGTVSGDQPGHQHRGLDHHRGAAPTAITVNPTATRAYVTNSAAGTVSGHRHHHRTPTVLTTIKVGTNPNAVDLPTAPECSSPTPAPTPSPRSTPPPTRSPSPITVGAAPSTSRSAPTASTPTSPTRPPAPCPSSPCPTTPSKPLPA